MDPRTEPVELYKVTGVEVEVSDGPPVSAPPWQGIAPPIEVYRGRASPPRRENLRIRRVFELHLGRSDAGRDHRRPLEP